MGICEPSLVLFTVSGLQTDALVSDYNSKDGRESVKRLVGWCRRLKGRRGIFAAPDWVRSLDHPAVIVDLLF